MSVGTALQKQTAQSTSQQPSALPARYLACTCPAHPGKVGSVLGKVGSVSKKVELVVGKGGECF
jgi:hypothetical protein